MRKFVIGLIIILIWLTSCKRDNDYVNYDDAIYSSDNQFKQLVMLVHFKLPDGSYLLLEKLDSIRLSVNGRPWAVVPSQSIDTTGIKHNQLGDFYSSVYKINYQVIAPYQISYVQLHTAGDYVEYMLNRLILDLGDYLCSIDELYFSDLSSNQFTIKPYTIKSFTVVENSTSAYVGEFEIELDSSFFYKTFSR